MPLSRHAETNKKKSSHNGSCCEETELSCWRSITRVLASKLAPNLERADICVPLAKCFVAWVAGHRWHPADLYGKIASDAFMEEIRWICLIMFTVLDRLQSARFPFTLMQPFMTVLNAAAVGAAVAEAVAPPNFRVAAVAAAAGVVVEAAITRAVSTAAIPVVARAAVAAAVGVVAVPAHMVEGA
jgi:hypothetical protein